MDISFFDWSSIRSNLISDLIFLSLTLGITPIFTIYLLKRRNRSTRVQTYSHILLEFCDFLSFTSYRDEELNSDHIQIFTRQDVIKEYKFVAISIVNVFSPIVYPKIELVIHGVHSKVSVAESYETLKEELSRLKELRLETEKILAVHALHVDEKIVIKISQLCLQIRKLEIMQKNNENFEQLSKKLGSEMTGIFGKKETVIIYKQIFRLMKEILETNYFDYSIAGAK